MILPFQRIPVFPLLVISALCFCSCKKDRTVDRAYYYWKTEFTLSDSQEIFLDSNHIKKLYIKLLDVDWNEVNSAYPTSITDFEYNFPGKGLHFIAVPVVFITNRTLQKIDTSEIPDLAGKIVRKLDRIRELTDRPIREYQVDCDWSESTKQKYFLLLKEIKKKIGQAQLSATIRLYQLKYPDKAGIPPVDRGMLMMYNLSNVKDYDVINSIFDLNTAKKYFENLKPYPLKLDVVLPDFSWGVVFKDRKFCCLLRDLNNEKASHTSYLVKSTLNHGGNYYIVKKDTVVNDIYLRYGDLVRIEELNEAELLEAAKLSEQALKCDSVTVSLFDFDESTIHKNSPDELEKIFAAYR